MERVFKIFSLLFAILFVWAAVLQWNDPDAYIWYIVYAIPAIASLFYLFGRLPKMAAFLLSLAYIAGTVLSWPAKFEGFAIGEGDIVNIEKGREAFGLLIIAIIMLVYALRIRYTKSKL